jgi:ascorbate PTS system EIIA or EIIAB component
MNDSEKQSKNLLAMISPEIVQAKVSVETWEEATDYVGSLLFQAGMVKNEYISAMKNVLLELGPYVVIAPGIVLLHARPEDGVISPCLGVITLKTPVPFGHSQNDPVDLVFALGAVDKQSHIHALQRLGTMLGNVNILSAIRSANTNGELFQTLTHTSS